MKPTLPFNKSFLSVIAILIIVLGVGLRLSVYFQNRSLIIDEANLARNIVERDYSGFFQTLDYEQYAPPLYASVVKGFTQVLGVNEFALRLPSLIAGILALVFMLLIGKLFIEEEVAIWYSLLLFSFSIFAIRYSTEFKQYAVDVAMTLGFIYWAIKCQKKDFTIPGLLIWAVAGAVAIWFSMPIIFVLASIGLAFLYRAWQQDKSMIPYIILSGVIWLFSFGWYYYLLLENDAHSDYLVNYHSAYFINFLPQSLTEANQSVKLLVSLFRTATDKTTVVLIWAILTYLVGIVLFIKEKKHEAILLGAPIFFCLLASHLKLYSLIPRLTLFMIPLILFTMGYGIAYLWRKSNTWIKGLLSITMVLSVVNTSGYEYFWSKLELEESKSVMQYLSEHKTPDDYIYVQHDGVPAFVFYNDLYDEAWHLENFHLGHWREQPMEIITNALDSTNQKTFWLFLSHTFPQENIDHYVNSAKTIATEVERYERKGASTYHFMLN